MAYDTSARTARIYRAIVVAVVAVYTGNRLPRGSRVHTLHDVTVDRCDGSVVGETLMSLSHWVIEIRSRYACNRAW